MVERKTAQAAEASLSPRQYLVLYRLAQLGYARREHLIRACFRGVADPEKRFQAEIEPLIRPRGTRADASSLILEHEATKTLYLNRTGRNALDSPPSVESRTPLGSSVEPEPAYFRRRDADGRPIPYGLRALPSERRASADAKLDEYVGIAEVLSRFLELEGATLTTATDRFVIQRVEVSCKPTGVVFPLKERKVELRPDGLILLYRRRENGERSVDWFYLEYEETSTPSKKLETLRRYAQFYWTGQFQRSWNAEYRFVYDLPHEGEEEKPPKFKVLVVVEDGDGSGYLDGILNEFRFRKDVGLDYRELGFPSDTMGAGQFLVCRRSALAQAAHALSAVWLSGANHLQLRAGEPVRMVSCLG